MKFSIIVPFKKGREYIKDCLDSLEDQGIRIYPEVVKGQPGFERIDELMGMSGAEGAAEVRKVLASGHVNGLEGLRNIKCYADLDPYVAKFMGKEPDAADDENESTEYGRDYEDYCSDLNEDAPPFIYIPYRDFEVIIVTDHSKEDISDITSQYSDLDIKTVSLSEGTGVAAARNLGISQAQGDYLLFLDCDDYLFPRALYYFDRAMFFGEDPEIIYGRKIWTYYTRPGFIATFKEETGAEENDSQAESGADDDSSDDSADKAAADAAAAKDYMYPEQYAERMRRRCVRRLVTRRKGLKNVSVLNVCFSRSLIEKHNIRFNESFRYYSDMSFVCEAIDHAESFRKCYKARYVKRKHNDPIKNPSLAQEKNDARFAELLEAYRYTRSRMCDASWLVVALDKKMINYYVKAFAPRIRRSEDDSWRNERFTAIADCISIIPVSTVREMAFYKRRLIKALLARDVEKSYKLVTRHFGILKIGRIIRHPRSLARTLYVHVFLKKPVVENAILFESFVARSYSDSPRAVYEYIQKNYPGKYKCVWVLDHRFKIPYGGKRVKRGSIRYMYYLATSKYFVFNQRQPAWFKKRDEMVFLQTWHGTPLKKLAFDLDDIFSAMPASYKQDVFKQANEWDYLASTSQYLSDIYRSCFLYGNRLLEYGYPRNDILLTPDLAERADKLKTKLGIPKDKKTVLYCPTWRDDEAYGHAKYKFTLQLDLDEMKQKLSDEYVILLRTHYLIADALDLSGYEGFAFNFSKYEDISELYLISDIVITDYSSIIFDYGIMKRPMLFYTYDLEKYRDMLRGFYVDMETTVPGPLLFTTGEICDALINIDDVTARYARKYDEFYARFCDWADGHATDYIVRDVFGLPLAGEKKN